MQDYQKEFSVLFQEKLDRLWAQHGMEYHISVQKQTGETRAKDKTCRTNYSAGKLKALRDGNEDRNALMIEKQVKRLLMPPNHR